MSIKNKIYLGLLLLVVLIIATVVIYFARTPTKNKIMPEFVEEKIMDGYFVGLTGQILKIKILLPSNDGSENASSTIEKEVNYNIDDRTKFYRYSDQAKTTAQYNQEFVEFSQKMKQLVAEGKNIVGTEPPTLYELEIIKPQDIKTGEWVNLYADREMVINESAVLKKVVVIRLINSDKASTPISYAENILGKLQLISGDRIIMLEDQIDPPTALASKPISHELVVGNTAKIFKQQPKNKEQYLEEQNKFNQKIEELSRANQPIIGFEPPSPELKEPINLSELVNGQSILVTVEINGDNKTVLEIDVLK